MKPTKTEAILAILKEQGKIASLTTIYHELSLHYPDLCNEDNWKAHVRGVLNREVVRFNSTIMRVSHSNYILTSLYAASDTPDVVVKAAKVISVGYVYLIESGQYIKIGRTSNITKRLSELQVGNPRKLRLISAVQVKNPIAMEKNLHEQFKDKNKQGEWYGLNSKDIISILRYLIDNRK
jgi:hypothetical protein